MWRLFSPILKSRTSCEYPSLLHSTSIRAGTCSTGCRSITRQSKKGLPDFFEYGSGRWLYNESQRLAERFLHFDVGELMEAVARATEQHSSDVARMGKLAEGGFNRVFQLTMRDGTEIIARLPYPSTQPGRLTIASEVATSNLVRSYGIPVPRIYGYSNKPDNPVGSEYIIMEKVKGTPLADVWFDLDERQRKKITGEIVKLEAKLFKIELPAYGSIFHAYDLPAACRHVPISTINTPEDQLCIGPDVAQMWWFQRRQDLDVDRGPFSDPTSLMRGAAEKELSFMQNFAKPRFPFQRHYREVFDYQKSSPKDQIRSLQQYLQIVPDLCPQDLDLCRPVIRHPDLNPNNIFVSESLEITSVLDWQHASVLPVFLAAGIPKYWQNYSDPEFSPNVLPKLPDGFEDMEEERQELARENLRKQELHFFYLRFTRRQNAIHGLALDRPTGFSVRRLFSHALEPWEGNHIPLQADLVYIKRNWQSFVKASPCPIDFSTEEQDEILKKETAQVEAESLMQTIYQGLGITSDGWVNFESYEDAKKQLLAGKQLGLSEAETEFERQITLEHWPFDDFDESE